MLPTVTLRRGAAQLTVELLGSSFPLNISQSSADPVCHCPFSQGPVQMLYRWMGSSFTPSNSQSLCRSSPRLMPTGS